MVAPELEDAGEPGRENPAHARDPAGHATETPRHLLLLVALLRAFIGFITLAYIGLIAVFCSHWLRAGDTSVLSLALLPAAMLLILNVVVWSA